MNDLRGNGPLLALSPHLDDAVMSAGALLAAVSDTATPVVICTVFAGDPVPPLSGPATEFHRDCGLGHDAVRVRLAEDLAAAESLGATAVHLPFLDALYRRFEEDWLCTWLGAHFDPELPDEPVLLDEITAELRALLRRLHPEAVWTCSAIGGHVDHRITLAAATSACAAEGVELLVWEDLPYAIGQPAGSATLVPAQVGEPHLVRKLVAIEQYRSQLDMLFPDGPDWRTAFEQHALTRLATHGTAELMWSTEQLTRPGWNCRPAGERKMPGRASHSG